MQVDRKNDQTVMDAIRAANNGDPARAARLFQEAGNQYRDPSEKRALWDAAARARRDAFSD